MRADTTDEGSYDGKDVGAKSRSIIVSATKNDRANRFFDHCRSTLENPWKVSQPKDCQSTWWRLASSVSLVWVSR